MRKFLDVLTLAFALALCGCVVKAYDLNPQAVDNEADTFRFRVFPNAFVMEGAVADRAADEEIQSFRASKGYASSRIVSRDSQGSAFVYTVKFTR